MLESGSVDNSTVNEYKFKDKSGTTRVEKIVKLDNEVTEHTIDGEKVKGNVKDTQVQYIPGNGEYFNLLKIDETNKLLHTILNQLKEMNYYLACGFGDKSDKDRLSNG